MGGRKTLSVGDRRDGPRACSREAARGLALRFRRLDISPKLILD